MSAGDYWCSVSDACMPCGIGARVGWDPRSPNAGDLGHPVVGEWANELSQRRLGTVVLVVMRVAEIRPVNQMPGVPSVA